MSQDTTCVLSALDLSQGPMTGFYDSRKRDHSVIIIIFNLHSILISDVYDYICIYKAVVFIIMAVRIDPYIESPATAGAFVSN